MWQILLNKNVLAIGGALLLIGTLYGTFKYQTYKIDKLNSEISKLEESLQIKALEVSGLQSTVSKMQTSIIKNAELSAEVANIKESIRKEIGQKLEVLEGNRIEKIAVKKPTLLQKKVNIATIKVFEEIEQETEEFRQNNK